MIPPLIYLSSIIKFFTFISFFFSSSLFFYMQSKLDCTSVWLTVRTTNRSLLVVSQVKTMHLLSIHFNIPFKIFFFYFILMLFYLRSLPTCISHFTCTDAIDLLSGNTKKTMMFDLKSKNFRKNLYNNLPVALNPRIIQLEGYRF